VCAARTLPYQASGSSCLSTRPIDFLSHLIIMDADHGEVFGTRTLLVLGGQLVQAVGLNVVSL
jgi:hypothetical protein